MVELDLKRPFTAGRARNEGFATLSAAHPELAFVQFVDGDCEIDPGWLNRGLREMETRSDLAVVCGRRRERDTQASIYNRLCDMEWDTPVGEAGACGGDALFRVQAFRDVGGFRAELVAGEEPELCARLRARGWKVLRIAAEMTRHDAAMTRFGQWWRRNVRAGHAYAECCRLHRVSPHPRPLSPERRGEKEPPHPQPLSPERRGEQEPPHPRPLSPEGKGEQEPPHPRPLSPERRGESEGLWRRETRSNWFWGLLFPLAVVAAAPFTMGLSLVLLLAYLVLGWRISRGRRRCGASTVNARLYAVFCVLGKFPQVCGQLRYHWGRLFGRPTAIIEYKGSQGRTAACRLGGSLALPTDANSRSHARGLPREPVSARQPQLHPS